MAENKAVRITKKRNVRIAVRDSQDLATIAYFDNSLPNSIHYKEAELTRFIEGNATVLKLKYRKRHPDANLIKEGCKLAFIYKEQSYWLNVMTTEDIGHYREIVAFSLSLEMNNEGNEEYSATSAMTIAQYINVFNFEKSFEIGVNEVSDKKLKLEWTGEQKILGRMFSLANKFDAEIEFVTELNDDYSLKRNVMNIRMKHDDDHQGIGVNSGKTLRVGEEIKVINRKSSIKDYYTAITGTGKDGLSLLNHVFEEKDSNGNVLFFSPAGSPHIYAPQARDKIPSLKNHKNDGYILARKGETEYSTIESLKGYLLSELKKNCDPVFEYGVEGYFDSNPGDTFRLVDAVHYDPPLYLEARVSEQTESFVDASRDETTFSNFVLRESQISQDLLDRVQSLINANKKYEYQIMSTNGTQFKNSEGETTLTARVLDGVKDVTDQFIISWTKDGTAYAIAKSINVLASMVNQKAVYRFEATEPAGKYKGGYEVTVTNVDDGFSPIVTINPDTSVTIEDSEGVKVTPPLKGDDGTTIHEPGKTVPSGSEGDYWYRENADGTTDLMLFKNGKWEVFIPDVSQKQLSDNLTEQVGKQNQAIKDMDEAVKQTEQAVIDQGTAFDQKIEQQKSELNQGITANKQKAEEALREANAGKDIGNDAKKAAEKAQTSATNALGQITGLNQELLSLSGELDGMITVVDDVAGTVDTLIKKTNDQTTEITKLQTGAGQMSALLGQVTTGLTDTTTKVTKLQADYDGFKLSVANTYASKTDLSATNTKLTNIEINAGQMLTTLTSVQNGLTASNTRITSIEAQAGQITTSLSNLQQDFNGMEIGSRNYLLNSDFSDASWLKNWANNDGLATLTKVVDAGKVYCKIGSVSGGGWRGLRQSFAFAAKKGQKVTISAKAKWFSGAKMIGFGMHFIKDGVIKAQAWKRDIALTGGLDRVSLTTTVVEDVDKITAFIVGPAEIAYEFAVTDAQFEIGTKATDHHRALEELATVTSVNEVRMTAEGTVATVASLQNQINWTRINSAQDLNLLTNPGKYFIAAAGSTNTPLLANRWCYVTVEKALDGHLIQTIQDDYDINQQYTRNYVSSGWSTWKKIANGTDITNVTNYISQVEQTSNKWQATVSQIQTGATNLVKNGAFQRANEGWGNNIGGLTFDYGRHSLNNKGKTGCHIFGTPTAVYQGIWQMLEKRTDVIPLGTKVYITCLLARDGGNVDGQSVSFGLNYRNDTTVAAQQWKFHPINEITSEFKQYTFEFTIGADGVKQFNLMVYAQEPNKYFNIYISDISVSLKKPMLVWQENQSNIVSQAQLTLLDNYIDMQLIKKGEVVTQLNLSQEGVTILGKLIELNGDVTMTAAWINKLYADTAFITNLNAKTLSAVQANITSIISQYLAADTITGRMLKIDIGLIDNLFATTALIERLTSKTAFINSIKAMDIDAGRITVGVLNGAVVNIINLNADNIVGGTLTAVDITGSNITGGQIVQTDSGSYNLHIVKGQLRFFRGDKRIATISPAISTATREPIGVTIVQESGEKFAISSRSQGVDSSFGDIFAIPAKSTLSNKLWNLYGTGTVNGNVTFNGIVSNNGNMKSTGMISADFFRLRDDPGYVIFVDSTNYMAITAHFGVRLNHYFSSGVKGIGTFTSGMIDLDNQQGGRFVAQGDQSWVFGRNIYANGNFSVSGSKNAIHPTRDGVRATPAYETAESYLGDIGRSYTKQNCEVWVSIDEIFSDTVNTDIAYEVFLQAYEDARFWVADFKADRFLVRSDKPMARFAWELKAKRRGYEKDRLVRQEINNNEIEDYWRKTA